MIFKGTNPGRTGRFLCCMFTKHGKINCHWYVSIGNLTLFCILGFVFRVSLLGKGNDQSFTGDVAIIFYALDSHWTVNHFCRLLSAFSESGGHVLHVDCHI